MQDFISANTQRVNKFKLALWNLVQWDQAGHYPYIYIPDNGTVESYDLPEDPEEVGSLGWIHDWCIRPVAIKKFYKYHLRGQKEVSKYSRRGRKLATLYKIEDASDYPYCPKYFRESTYRPWKQYVKNFVDSKRAERELWYSLNLSPGPTDYPTDQDVIDILLQVSQFTCEASR